ncbi:TetR/AcrR family transcriptional regulator [Arthrobacter sp. TMS1-12-1]
MARGVRAVGANEIIAASAVAKATFYRHFPSKDNLIEAFFKRRQDLFTIGYLAAESLRRGTTPREQLLAIFDIFDEWFQAPDFTGCPYMRALLEASPSDRASAASLTYIKDIHSSVEASAAQMGLTHPEDFAYCWLTLMQGAVVSAVAGDTSNGSRIRKLGETLITLHTPADTPTPDTPSAPTGSTIPMS